MSNWQDEVIEAQQQGDTVRAKAVLDQQLSCNPDNGMARFQMGMIYAASGDIRQALGYLEHATLLEPSNPLFHNNFANALKQSQQFDRAEQHYRQALALNDCYPQALNNYGTLLYSRGEWQAAKESFEKAIRYFPDYVDAHYNLGNTLAQLDQVPSAIMQYKRTLHLNADHPTAPHNLGICLVQLGYFAEAIDPLTTALTAERDNVELHYHLALSYTGTDNIKQAIHHYTRVTELSPEHSNAWHNLATLELQTDNKDKALLFYQKAHALNPNNQTAAHLISALQGQSQPGGAPHAYVESLFDHYASNYDEHVTKVLNYQVPHQLRQIVAEHAKKIDGLWRVADLGCGSGLCAPYFRDMSEKFVGVDLSSAMLKVAKQRGGYDKLYHQDIESYLIQNTDHDLCIAADVLVYFGKLDELFATMHKSLKRKRYFCFSTELHTGTETYKLQTSGRYAHRLDYLTQCIEENHFKIVHQEKVTLRHQDNQPVTGTLTLVQSY